MIEKAIGPIKTCIYTNLSMIEKAIGPIELISLYLVESVRFYTMTCFKDLLSVLIISFVE
jgi:uncharacterized membrane protein YfhO